MEESNIATTSVILKQTAQELNIPVEKVEFVYEALISYLKKLCAYSSAIAIFLPHLGTMYLRIKVLYAILNKLKEKEKESKLGKIGKRKLKYMLEKEKVLQNYLKNYPRPLPRSYHIKKSKFRMKSYTDFKSLEEIEKFQNSRNSK